MWARHALFRFFKHYLFIYLIIIYNFFFKYFSTYLCHFYFYIHLFLLILLLFATTQGEREKEIWMPDCPGRSLDPASLPPLWTIDTLFRMIIIIIIIWKRVVEISEGVRNALKHIHPLTRLLILYQPNEISPSGRKKIERKYIYIYWERGREIRRNR